MIFNEDCLAGMAKLPDNSIDFICTDLPYSITDAYWDKGIDLQKFWAEARRILKPCASAAMFASGTFTFELAASNFEQYKYKWIWVKNMVTDFVNAKNRPMRRYEEILLFSNGQVAHVGKSKNRMNYYPQGLVDCNFPPRADPTTAGGGAPILQGSTQKKNDISTQRAGVPTNSGTSTKKRTYAFWNQQGGLAAKHTECLGKPRPSDRESYIQTQTGYPTDVLYYKVPHNVGKLHPNQKPTDLLEYLIKTYTQEGDTVLDATCGSGSTGVACVNTNRNFIGFEIDKIFFEIAKKRIEKALREKLSELF